MLHQTAITRRMTLADFTHVKAVRGYLGRVIGRNPANLTVDVDLVAGGTLNWVPLAWSTAGLTHGRCDMPRMGDLVLIGFGHGRGLEPMVLASFTEPIPGGNPSIVGGQVGKFCRLTHLFTLEDLTPGQNVSRCPT